jgi:hypothetical protein
MGSLFIIIFEDNEIKYSHSVDTDLLDAADDGLIDVLDISDPDCIQQYANSGWSAIKGMGRNE